MAERSGLLLRSKKAHEAEDSGTHVGKKPKEKTVADESDTLSLNEAANPTVKVTEDIKLYMEHIEYINEFVQKKSKTRTDNINRMRDRFEQYRDCCGVVKRPIYFSEKEKGIMSLRYSPNMTYLAAGFGSGRMSLYKVDSYSLLNTILDGKENGYPISCVRFMPNNDDLFYAASGEGIVFGYDIERDILSSEITQENCEINSIDIDPFNSRIVTGGSDYSVQVYDLNNLGLLACYKDMTGKDLQNSTMSKVLHSNRVYAVKFLPDETNTFVSGGWDNKLKFWDLRTKYGCVHTITGPHISGDAIDIRDNLLLTASWEPKNYLQVRDVRTFHLIQNLCPFNAPDIQGGVYAFATQFFAGDPYNDIILLASMGFKSLDVISLSNNVILHSYVSNQACVAVDSRKTQIVFGGTDNAFNFVAFYKNILFDLEARDEVMSKDAEEESVSDEEGSNMDLV